MSTVRLLRFEQYVESPLIKIEGMNLEFLHENFTYCINLFTKHSWKLSDIQFCSLASKYITFGIGKMIIVLTDETILSDDSEIPNNVQKHSKNDSKHENDRKLLLFLY